MDRASACGAKGSAFESPRGRQKKAVEDLYRLFLFASFDVHMASEAAGGADLACTDCHITQDHRIAGRGIDLRQTDMVAPEYGFWKGYSYSYASGTVAKPASTGRILMGGPEGSIRDDNANIYPLKHHVAIQAIDPTTRRRLPVHMGVLFQTGDVHDAILRGTAAVGWDLPNGYIFVETGPNNSLPPERNYNGGA